MTRTRAEVSVVCTPDAEPEGAQVESGWRALEVAGPLDFGLVGIVAELTAALAQAQISVYVLSTFDTDYLLVRQASLATAVEVLRSAGHAIAPS